MATVNIAITATQTQLSKFADELGYQEFVFDNAQGLIPNPIDRRAYLQDYFKSMTVNELAKVRILAIEKQEIDKREADKQAVRSSIESAVAVTFKP